MEEMEEKGVMGEVVGDTARAGGVQEKEGPEEKGTEEGCQVVSRAGVGGRRYGGSLEFREGAPRSMQCLKYK